MARPRRSAPLIPDADEAPVDVLPATEETADDPVVAAVLESTRARLAAELHSDIGRALQSAIHDRDRHAATAKRLATELAETAAELRAARATIEAQRRIISPDPAAEAPEPVVYCPTCSTSLGYRSRGDVPCQCHVCGTQVD